MTKIESETVLIVLHTVAIVANCHNNLTFASNYFGKLAAIW